MYPWDTKIWANSFMSIFFNGLCFVCCIYFCSFSFLALVAECIVMWHMKFCLFDCFFLSWDLCNLQNTIQNLEQSSAFFTVSILKKGEHVNELKFQKVWIFCDSLLWPVFSEFWLNICYTNFALIVSDNYNSKCFHSNRSYVIWSFKTYLSLLKNTFNR